MRQTNQRLTECGNEDCDELVDERDMRNGSWKWKFPVPLTVAWLHDPTGDLEV